jgi:hypothetical protein
VVTDIARPYPIPIICALLGAPRQDWQLFSEPIRAEDDGDRLTDAAPALHPVNHRPH